MTRELAQAYHLDLTQQNLYVVTSFLNKKEYQEWLEGGADRCFNDKRNCSINGISE